MNEIKIRPKNTRQIKKFSNIMFKKKFPKVKFSKTIGRIIFSLFSKTSIRINRKISRNISPPFCIITQNSGKSKVSLTFFFSKTPPAKFAPNKFFIWFQLALKTNQENIFLFKNIREKKFQLDTTKWLDYMGSTKIVNKTDGTKSTFPRPNRFKKKTQR